MRKFHRDTRGAVTVIVSLLLIPAILISGTGVDLARIYAARSTLQDANQLAANSALASYDALLQDLYGVFGMMIDDPAFGELPDKYIRPAVMGSGQQNKIGTFSLFYGSNLVPGSISAAPNQHLGNPAVLRRQIEEYSKFRAPVVVAELLMDKLEVFEKVQEDAKVIQTKMEVDDRIEELEKYYQKIYDDIQVLSKCRADENTAMGVVRTSAKKIQSSFSTMADIREEYAKKLKEMKEAQAALRTAEQDYADADPETDDLEALAEEVTYWEDKIEELMDELEALEASYTSACGSIEAESRSLKKSCEAHEKTLKTYLDKLDDLKDHCEKAEKEKEELRDKIETLKTRLAGGCSQELKDGLQKPEAGAADKKSILERYEDLLIYNIEQMGIDMYNADYEQVSKTIEAMMNASLGGKKLLDFGSMDVEGTYPIEGDAAELSPFVNGSTNYQPHPGRDGTGFLNFWEVNAENRKFYEELEKIYSHTEGAGASRKQLMKAVSKIFGKAQDLFGGLIFEPEGAKHLKGAKDGSTPSSGTNFGTDGKWSDENEGKKKLKGALDDDFLGSLATAASEAGNKILLLVYGTEMFSDASTPGSEETDEERKAEYPRKSMAGIPMTTDVNYYFQSELEYLYNGNLSDAQANLRSVAGMIFLVRFVFDYVASFAIPSVNSVVNSVRSALAFTGPFAVLAGELARLALAIGEAAMDVARLRTGDQVAIYKKEDDWKLSIAGLTEAATDSIDDAVLDDAFDTEGKDGDDEGLTLGYTDYIRLFLLLVPGDKLADRIGNLIELNVTNKKEDINADEEKMASAKRIDLAKAITGFSLKTTAELRMLFLSMPFAQEGINGVVPPKTFPITVTDYRGY